MDSTTNSLVETPEGAVLRVDRYLLNEGDPDHAFALTVHLVENDSVCNFWVNYGGTWNRFMPERVLRERRPNAGMLLGELMRAALDPTQGPRLNSDIRFKRGMIALTGDINMLDTK